MKRTSKNPQPIRSGSRPDQQQDKNETTGTVTEDVELRSNANHFLQQIGEVCRNLRLHHARQLLPLESEKYEIPPFQSEWHEAYNAWSKLRQHIKEKIPAEERLLSLLEARLTLLSLKLPDIGNFDEDEDCLPSPPRRNRRLH